jgi:DNA-directed RNA polymerase specialized sigma24 family protein
MSTPTPGERDRDDAYHRADVVAVRVLHGEGLTPEQIAARTTLTVDEVKSLLSEEDQ